MEEVVKNIGTESTFPDFVSRVLTSDRDKSLANAFVSECRKIYPIKKVDIRRMDVLQHPEVEATGIITSIAPVPPKEPEPAPAGEVAPAKETAEGPGEGAPQEPPSTDAA
jgi:hypothetical protein